MLTISILPWSTDPDIFEEPPNYASKAKEIGKPRSSHKSRTKTETSALNLSTHLKYVFVNRHRIRTSGAERLATENYSKLMTRRHRSYSIVSVGQETVKQEQNNLELWYCEHEPHYKRNNAVEAEHDNGNRNNN